MLKSIHQLKQFGIHTRFQTSYPVKLKDVPSEVSLNVRKFSSLSYTFIVALYQNKFFVYQKSLLNQNIQIVSHAKGNDPTTTKKGDLLGRTLNCIIWLGASSGDMGCITFPDYIRQYLETFIRDLKFSEAHTFEKADL